MPDASPIPLQRHKWSAPVQDILKTERTCEVPGCGLVKVTRHDNPHGPPWTEWARDGQSFQAEATPPCTGLAVEAVPARYDKAAVISGGGRYRFHLSRRWGDGVAMIFVMLNPSTADASIDDPTIRRCVGFARRERFDAVEVVNLFAYRATDPRELDHCLDPFGEENADYLDRAISSSLSTGAPIVCAWGTGSSGVVFVPRAQRAGVDLYCLGVTKHGFPRHPLYVKADEPLEIFRSGSQARPADRPEVRP
jgi:hypothetical protein